MPLAVAHASAHDRSSAQAFRRRVALIVTGVLVGLFLLSPPFATAQNSEIPVVTRTTAIQNARIVQAPGRVIERGTVVFQDGLITDVGTNVDIPYDAEIIAGDSLIVYAGFVDGLSHAGIPEDSAEQDREEPINAADPPDALAGIQPNRHARDLLDNEESTIDALRKLGFTAAHVVPRGRMLPGTGSIVLLSEGDPREMVLRPDVSLFMQFQGAPGVYPATSIGVMSTLRQLMREAERRRRIEIMYAENPAGLERPSFDPVHEAFYPVISQEKPLYVLAAGDDSAMEVHRALRLRDELGFELALAGLSQGFDVVAELEQARIPLFLTLHLPEPPEDADRDTTAVDTTKAMTPEDPASFFVSDLRIHSYEDVETEAENLTARQALERERYFATAADFHEAGLRFGMMTLGADAKDIRKNIRKMIDAGLPEDAALAALTIDGARLLGLDRSMGTVEEGKLANLVVTKGSYFDPESPVRYVFVDGRKHEYEEDKPPAGPADVAGEWQITVMSGDGPISGTLTLESAAGELTGTVSSPNLSAPSDLEDVELDGSRLTFTFRTSEYGRISAEITISGDSLSGTMEVPGEGTMDVTGTRPDRR